MPVYAWHIGNRARVIADKRTGTVEDVKIISGDVMYLVVNNTSDAWEGWFTAWEIEHI